MSSDWPGLYEYQNQIENDDGSKRDVLVNEFNCVMGASLGRRNPTEAGIRIGHEKYFFTKQELDT